MGLVIAPYEKPEYYLTDEMSKPATKSSNIYTLALLTTGIFSLVYWMTIFLVAVNPSLETVR